MIFRRTERFLEAFRSLPTGIQRKMLRALALFGQDQRHPSLEVKKLQGRDGVWEARVNQKYRSTVHMRKMPVVKPFVFCATWITMTSV